MIATFDLTILLKAPWLTRDNNVGVFGVDAPLARTPEGKYYLPGTLLVGRLADAFAHLGMVDPHYSEIASKFLPSLSQTPKLADIKSTGQEARRNIFISDLIFEGDNSSQPDPFRTRIAIEEQSGRVADGAMQVIEAPFAAGEEVTFHGKVRLLGEKGQISSFKPMLEKALLWLTQLAGGRTYGHGVLSMTNLVDVTATSQNQIQITKPRFRIKISAHDPMCVGEKRSSPNSYTSSEVIAGNVIKGAIARNILASAGKSGMLSDNKGLGDLAKGFSNLQISHAFPVTKDENSPSRPKRAPFSLAWNGKAFVDLAELHDPNAPQPGLSFFPDWKQPTREKFEALTNWSKPGTDFRIRTAIDAQFRSSDEGRLFAIEYLRHDTHDWIAHVDYDGEQSPNVREELSTALAGGLAGVGRGGAYCSIEVEELGAQQGINAKKGDRLILTLQTPALLRDPTADDAGDLTQTYAAVFEAIGLKGLKSIFIKEQLHGGEFFARRAQNKTYKPWLLTQAGSCFVFEVRDDALDLTSLQRFGLNIPEMTKKFYGIEGIEGIEAWKICPYLPKNGYGEVDLRIMKPDETRDSLAHITQAGEVL